LHEYGKSADIEELVGTGYGRANAVHDVSAYLSVRDKRAVPTKIKPQKAKYWFVSANSKLSYFNQKHSCQTPEIVMPGELTSLLFLKNPVKYSSVVSKKGLGALIAQVLIEEYADKDLINEFDAIVRTCVSNLSEDDYELLLEHIALESTSRLRNLIDESCDKDEFSFEVHNIVEKVRSQKAAQAQQNQEIQEEKDRLQKANEEKNLRNSELELRLAELEKKVAYSQEEVNNLKEREVRNKQITKRWKYAAFGFVVFIACLALSRFVDLINWLKIVIDLITSLSGLWAFINLLLNLFKRSPK